MFHHSTADRIKKTRKEIENLIKEIEKLEKERDEEVRRIEMEADKVLIPLAKAIERETNERIKLKLKQEYFEKKRVFEFRINKVSEDFNSKIKSLNYNIEHLRKQLRELEGEL